MKLKPTKFTFPSSGYKSPWLSYWMVVALFVSLFAITIYRVGLGVETNDTITYYASGDLLFRGIIDDIRTPVYPIILYILKWVFGFEGSEIAVTLLQIIVFGISVAYVNKSMRIITPQCPRLCFWITILYLLLQFYDRWHWLWRIVSVISGGFAISLSAFLAYCLIRAAQPGASIRYSIWSSVWLLLLVFLHPVLVCYVPVVVFFWIALYLRFHRAVLKNCLRGMGGVVVVVALIGAYSYGLNRRYAIHSISFVGSINNYAMLRYGGIITPDDTDDPTFKAFIERQIAIKTDSLTIPEQWSEMYQIFNFPLQLHSVVEQTVNYTIKSNPKAIVRVLLKRYNEVNDSYVNIINMLIFVTGGGDCGVLL